MATSEPSARAEGELQPEAAPAGAPPVVTEVAGLRASVPRILAGLALLATVIARAVSPALPGSRAGIAQWITVSEVTAAVLSQLMVLGGALLAFRLVIATLRERDLGFVYRLVAVPVSAGVLTLIMASASHIQEPVAALGLAIATALLALGATPLATANPGTRALGVVLGVSGASAFVHALARVMAMRASEQALPSLFMASRAAATVSLALDATAVVLVLFWLWSARRVAGAVVLLSTALLSALVAWGAVRGSGFDAPFWQVLAARALAGIVRNPMPLVLPFFRYVLEVAAVLVAGATLVFPRRAAAVQGAMALALLARSSTDIPLLALFLALAALLGPLLALPPADERRGVPE